MLIFVSGLVAFGIALPGALLADRLNPRSANPTKCRAKPLDILTYVRKYTILPRIRSLAIRCEVVSK
jgi:hypothetical protein